MRARRISMLAAAAFFAGACARPDLLPYLDAAADAADAPMLDARDAPATDVPAVPDVPDVALLDVTDAASADVADVADVQGADAPDVRDVPAVVDAGVDAPVVADVLLDVARDAGDAPDVVDVPDVPNAPDVVCASGLTACSGVCVPTSTDPLNCGSCGNACDGAHACRAGSCAMLTCPPGMALIPAATFQMGDPMSDDTYARPVHPVQLSAYCIDLHEVTVADYRGCPSATCTTPRTGTSCNNGVAGRDNHPVNCVNWAQGDAYCRWRGAHLPTEAQWEFAARSTDARTYPWGNPLPTNQLCWMSATTCPVGSFPAGNSAYGVADMAGNVCEWVADWWSSYAASTVPLVDPTGPTSSSVRPVRGGAFSYTTESDLRSSWREASDPTNTNPTLGFRCARDPM